jgi:non-haem Fe2+, alpha-ketoglutarate-dependent halogenase
MKALTIEAVAFYHEHGYYAPVRVLEPGRAAALRAQLEAFESEHAQARRVLRNKSHLLVTWLDALIREPRILDAVEDVIGPNILCWASSFFIKDAHDPSYVSWHQDSTYWGLEPPDIVTAWVALSESAEANGAMQVIPGSHELDQLGHRDTFAAHNLLSRGQEIAVEVDERQAVALPLAPGEMSLHHPWLRAESVGSPKNRLRDPVSADTCASGGRHARQRDAGARGGSVRQFRSRAGAGRRSVARRAGAPRGNHETDERRADARHTSGGDVAPPGEGALGNGWCLSRGRKDFKIHRAPPARGRARDQNVAGYGGSARAA